MTTHYDPEELEEGFRIFDPWAEDEDDIWLYDDLWIDEDWDLDLDPHDTDNPFA